MRFPPLKTMLKVLAFMVLSAVFTFALAVKIGNFRLFSHTYNVSAVFGDASGVFKGDAVKLAGVDVGRVTGTHIQNGRAVVDFNLNDDVKLTDDSIVAIRWRNVLGLRFLYVYPGHGGTALEDGDVIPLSQTEDAGDIGQFLNELGPILRAIDPEKANAFLDAVNTALGGSEVAVRQLLGYGATLAGGLGKKDKEIGDLISNSSKIMAAYASQSGNLGKIIDDLDTLGAKLAGITPDLNALIVNFADVQSQLEHVLKTSHGNIDATLSDLDSVTATLAFNKKNLESTLCTLPLGVAPYYQTSSWGQWFNVRVTTITFKDNSGGLIAQQNEGPSARGNNQGRKVTTCGAVPVHDPAEAAAAAAREQQQSGLQSLLDLMSLKAA